MKVIYTPLLIGSIFLSGCTVGWYSVRDKAPDINAGKATHWSCPSNIKLIVKSTHYTNTFGEKPFKPEIISKLKDKITEDTAKTLKEIGCPSAEFSEDVNDNTLSVNVTEQANLSALPQEWLTGLSLGLIPSWGTRPEQWKFEFLKGAHVQTFVVDDTRFNHLIAFPFFWLTIPLANYESEYEKALRQFASNS